jgi:hypothetical protein
MKNDKVIERLEVMRDCYMVFFDNNGGTGYEAKYKENKEAFDIAVSLLKNIPEGARLIDANGLKADLQLYFNEAVLQGVTAETAFLQILADIDNAPTVLGGES